MRGIEFRGVLSSSYKRFPCNRASIAKGIFVSVEKETFRRIPFIPKVALKGVNSTRKSASLDRGLTSGRRATDPSTSSRAPLRLYRARIHKKDFCDGIYHRRVHGVSCLAMEARE